MLASAKLLSLLTDDLAVANNQDWADLISGDVWMGNLV